MTAAPRLQIPTDDLTAAEWLVRLEGAPLDATEQARFEAWQADPGHAAALAEAREAWRQAETLRPQRETLLRHVLPGVRVSGPFGRAVWQVPLAVAASLLLAIGGGAIYRQATAPDYSTAPGEVRTFALPDGSRLTLDGNSAASIAFDTRIRRIDLRDGAAYVVAAPKLGTETRPLVVMAQGGTAQALGTQFAVERLGDVVTVSVTEHSVAVVSGDTRATVHEGQSVRYDRNGLTAVEGASMAPAAWRDGRMVFDRIPLKAVVAQLNRYRKNRVYIAGNALGERRVSGVFDTHDPDNALGSITAGLEARRLDTPAGTIIYPK